MRSILREAAAARQEHLYVETSPSPMPVQGALPTTLEGDVVDIHGALVADNTSVTIVGGISGAQFQLRGMSLYPPSASYFELSRPS